MRRRDFGAAIGAALLGLAGGARAWAAAARRPAAYPHAWTMSGRLTALVEARPELENIEVYEQLKPAHRVFQAVWVTQREVNGDGFYRFLTDYGAIAPHAPAAMRTIGAPKTAAIVEQAMAAPKGYVAWSDDEGRRAALDEQSEAVDAALDRLDDAFADGAEDLTALLYRYVAARPGDFGSMKTRD